VSTIFNNDKIKMVEFEKHYQSYVVPMVALYHEDTAIEEEVREAIETHDIGEPNNVLIISKQLYSNVFFGGSLA